MAVTNLFTNPRLKGDGTWAEVRRNLEADPSFEGSQSWTQQSVSATRSTEWASTGEKSLRLEGAGEAHNSAIYRPLSSWGVEEGKTYTAMVKLHLPSTLTGTMNQSALSISLNSAGFLGAYAENRSGTQDLRFTFTVDGSAISPGALLRIYHGTAAGNGVSYWDDLLVVEGIYSGPYFDGSTTPETAGDVVQPEDFRWRWLGAENASESVMEIEQVAGLTAPACIAGVSTANGKPAMRLIPTSATSTAVLSLPVPVAARASGTLMGTVTVVEPISGVQHPRSRSLRVMSPDQFSAPAPNEPGSFDLRLSFGGLTSTNTAYIYHGGAQGSGDVWWTDIGLFEGEYNGPYGDGSMRGWYWADEPDNSESIKAPRPNPDHRRMMYFGVPGAMSWVPCPQIERPSGLSQWQEEVPLLNGGLHVRRSYGGHRVFEMTWTGISAEEAQLLEAYASGVYGDGLIHWLDPMMADKNVLPIWWSAPAMGALGAPSLGAGGSKPIIKGGLPPQSALFDFREGRGRDLWIPVPENHSLWIYHRAVTTGSVALIVFELEPTGIPWASLEVPPLDALPGASPLFHEFRPSMNGTSGVRVLYRSTGYPASGTVTVSDIGAQVLPLGVKPEQELPYLAGMGADGCVVTEFEKTDMSAAFNKVNVTMVLKEVGPWR